MEGMVKERNQVTVEEFHLHRHENTHFLVFWHLAEGLVTKRARIFSQRLCSGKRIKEKIILCLNNDLELFRN
jgi:hypothetical protein